MLCSPYHSIHSAMDIKTIKAKLGYDTLTFCEVHNGDTKEDFVKHWDNDNRVAIIMNSDLFHTLLNGQSNRNDLAMNTFDKVSQDKVDTNGNPIQGRPYTLVSVFALENVVGSI